MGNATSDNYTQSEISESKNSLNHGSSPFDLVRHNADQMLQELQKQAEQKEANALKVRSALEHCQDQSQQDRDEIQKLLVDGSLTSKHLSSVYEQAKEQIKRLVDAGVDPADEDIAIKQKSNEAEAMYSRDRNKDKRILADFKSKHKGKSIADTLEQVNKNQEVLDALADSTTDYLKNALKLSPDDIFHYRSKVREIYVHHGDRVSDAHTLYQYYDLQRRKDELKHMTFGKDKLCRQAYNIMSLNACQNRRHKKEVTRVLEAEEPRRKHLVEKYGNLKLEKGGKRGKEKRMLDDLIKARREKTETDRAFELFTTILEKSERYIINDGDLTKDEREKRKDILKSARENFDRLRWNRSFSEINHHMERNQIYAKHLIKKYGSTPLAGRLNDVASDGGAIITVAGTMVGWTHAVPFVAA